MTFPGVSIRSLCKTGLGVLAALASLAPVGAMAWTRIGETPEVTLYVNRNSIEKEDTIRRVWGNAGPQDAGCRRRALPALPQ